MERTTALARWRHGRGRLVALALTATLALLSAPLRTALRVGCDLCPPDCPMHDAAHRGAPDHDGETERPRLRCHNAAPDSHAAPAHGARIGKPACGSHAAIAAVDTAPMLVGDPPTWQVADATHLVPPVDRAAHGRDRDPPDTPPPVLGA